MTTNKARILGGVLLIIGLILNNTTIEFYGIGFISGALIGIGGGFLLFGKTIFNKVN